MHGGENVVVNIDNLHMAGYETGFITQGAKTYEGGEITITNSEAFSTAFIAFKLSV